MENGFGQGQIAGQQQSEHQDPRLPTLGRHFPTTTYLVTAKGPHWFSGKDVGLEGMQAKLESQLQHFLAV